NRGARNRHRGGHGPRHQIRVGGLDVRNRARTRHRLGVALLGSLTTAVYRTHVPVPGDLAPATAHALTDSLSAAVTVAETLPTGALSAAQEAFTTGLNVASLVACTTVAAACVLCLVRLRHVPRLGQQPPETE